MKAQIFDIERNSFVDGPGIRTTVFFKGCNLNCGWCHNPESQSQKSQIMFYKDKCVGCGKCKEICPNNFQKCDFCGKCTIYCPVDARKICGKTYTVEDVFGEIIKDKLFYENSNGGVTFSGGECMLQIDFLFEILKKCKENNIHTAIDTAGNVPFHYFEKIMDYTDLFLYDIKCFSKELHKKGTGISNEQILSNLKKLSNKFNGDIIIRIPVIGGFNDDVDEMLRVKNFLSSINYKSVDLLEYHKMGEGKYSSLNMQKPTFYAPKNLQKIKDIFGS